MEKTVAIKMGLTAGWRTYLDNADKDAVAAMNHPELKVIRRLSGMFDYIHFFAENQKHMDRRFPTLKKHLAQGGMLWLSWPKAKQLGTDLTIKDVIRIGYDHGLVESTALSVNAIWSALKFTHPKSGKEYHNSYGTLQR
ncbi:hypothetical protein [uncultured Flavobacterium sp.]|uniref:hypothetical protein n=1 Tax=uncultured Flavobacterium sp. TaxID=165435 RepID=UPI0025EA6C68|nr:hypothetical protein [uncultured Flavobacterium sp.]